jgi:hypothetical protein
MRTLESRSGTESLEVESDRKSGTPPIWGYRTNYRMLREVVAFLHKDGPQRHHRVAEYMIQESDAAGNPNPRRTDGSASAEQAIVTLKNLGLVEREPGIVRLTERGEAFSRSIGTPREETEFRAILLGAEPFLWLWNLASHARNLGRSDVLRLAHRVYPGYNDETIKTLAGVFMNYARAAGLLKEGPGGRRYSVSAVRTAVTSLEAESPETDASDVVSTPGPESVSTAGVFDTGHESMNEAARLLGWALADDGVITEARFKSKLARAFDHALSSHAEAVDLPLVRLAQQQALSAAQTGDVQLLRWATRLVNGILALDARLPSPSE